MGNKGSKHTKKLSDGGAIELGATSFTVRRRLGNGAFGRVHILLAEGSEKRHKDKTKDKSSTEAATETGGATSSHKKIYAVKFLAKRLVLEKGQKALQSALSERNILSELNHP